MLAFNCVILPAYIKKTSLAGTHVPCIMLFVCLGVVHHLSLLFTGFNYFEEKITHCNDGVRDSVYRILMQMKKSQVRGYFSSVMKFKFVLRALFNRLAGLLSPG